MAASSSAAHSDGAVVFLAGTTERRLRPVHRVGRCVPHRLPEEPSADTTQAARRVAAERQRIAGLLHDDVSSALFAAAATIQRAELLPAADADELRRALARVGDQVHEAAERLREVLRTCTPVDPADGVPAAAQRDLDDLGERTGIYAHLVLRGTPRALSPGVERTVLNCLRQALFNIERHAAATTVVVALQYLPEELVLVVQDDGCGLPAGYEPRAVPVDGHHWGFTSMARQVEQRGGELDLTGDEDGGTRLRIRLPAEPLR